MFYRKEICFCKPYQAASGVEARARGQGPLCEVQAGGDAVQLEDQVAAGGQHRPADERLEPDVALGVKADCARARRGRCSSMWHRGNVRCRPGPEHTVLHRREPLCYPRQQLQHPHARRHQRPVYSC